MKGRYRSELSIFIMNRFLGYCRCTQKSGNKEKERLHITNFGGGESVFVPVIRCAFEKVTVEFKITYFYVLNPGVPKG
jgi:hypothetical protein